MGRIKQNKEAVPYRLRTATEGQHPTPSPALYSCNSPVNSHRHPRTAAMGSVSRQTLLEPGHMLRAEAQ